MMGVPDLAAVPTTLIDTIGVPASLQVSKTGAVVSLRRVGFASVGRMEEALVNAYGVTGKVITVKAADAEPVRLDRIVVLGESYTIDAVNPIHAPGSGTVVAYRCYVKGK